MERLAGRFQDAVRRAPTVNGNGSNGSGREQARRIALDVGTGMLAEVSAGTAQHSNDVVLITEAIGRRMGIAGDDADDLLAAARLHDIGKAWVPRALLEKAGPLSDEEWEVMRQHTLVGERILSSVEGLDDVARLVRHSHERWDGSGYPDGLSGSEIPLGSRIVFCADAFHAIRCDRPYRAGRSAREAVAEISRCAGTQFDPRVAGALEQVVRERNRRPHGLGRSSRLFALLMCLVIGGAGTAIARSGLLGELPTHPASVSGIPPPRACGTAACPGVAAPVGGLNSVGGPDGVPGPRPVSPGKPGHRHNHGAKGGPQGGKGHGAKGHNGKGSKGKSAAAKAQHGHDAHTGASQGSSGSSGAPPSAGRAGSQGSSSSGGGGSGGHSSSHSSSRGGGGGSPRSGGTHGK